MFLHNGIILIVNCFKFVWQIYVIFFASKRINAAFVAKDAKSVPFFTKFETVKEKTKKRFD